MELLHRSRLLGHRRGGHCSGWAEGEARCSEPQMLTVDESGRFTPIAANQDADLGPLQQRRSVGADLC